jgi:hypothetical protein
MRQKLNQLYSKKIISQTSLVFNSDSNGFTSGFTDTIIIYLYSLYENGIVWVGGPINHSRSGGNHAKGFAYDFWGLAYRQEIESAGGIKGFSGPIAMFTQSSRQYAYPASNSRGNPADPNIYRLADLGENNLDSAVKAKILDLYGKAAKIANLTGALTGIITHDVAVPTTKANISGQYLAGHTANVGQGNSVDGSNGHHNHMHVNLRGSAKLVSAGSVVANVVSNCGEQPKEAPKVNFRTKRESNV